MEAALVSFVLFVPFVANSFSFYYLRFTGQWPEVRRRTPVPRRCFVGRGDPQEHRFIERTCDEVDADRERCWYRSDETSTGVRIPHAVPDLRGEAGGNRNRWEALLADQ